MQPCDSEESISCFTTSLSTDNMLDRSTDIRSRSVKTHTITLINFISAYYSKLVRAAVTYGEMQCQSLGVIRSRKRCITLTINSFKRKLEGERALQSRWVCFWTSVCWTLRPLWDSSSHPASILQLYQAHNQTFVMGVQVPKARGLRCWVFMHSGYSYYLPFSGLFYSNLNMWNWNLVAIKFGNYN